MTTNPVMGVSMSKKTNNALWPVYITVGGLLPNSSQKDNPSVIQNICQVLLDAGDATLHFDANLNIRQMVEYNPLFSLNGGQKAKFYSDGDNRNNIYECYVAGNGFQWFDSPWRKGIIYRKLNNIWLSFEMGVPGGRIFMKEVLSRTNFPDDKDKMLDYIETLNQKGLHYNLCIGPRTASLVASEPVTYHHGVKCLWIPQHKPPGIMLSGKTSLNAIAHKYIRHSLYRFSKELVYLEKDILAACGLRTVDVRKKDPAAIAMAAMSDVFQDHEPDN